MEEIKDTTPPPYINNKKKNCFFIRKKLMFIIGALSTFALYSLVFLISFISKKAVIEKVETHLTDKTADTAEIIDGQFTAFFRFLEGITRMPQIRDTLVSYQHKTYILIAETKFNLLFEKLYIVDTAI